MNRYRIPKSRCRTNIRVSNSRFISTIDAVFSAGEANAFIREMRGEMPDASHHVYAFKIGYGSSVKEGMSDAGEPSGTSGPPTLAVLRGAALGDVCIVTTRYFGGTKLGTGGLVSAYKASAQEAFAALETEEKVLRVAVQLTTPYALFEQIKLMFDDHEVLLDDEQFTSDVTLRLRLPEEQFAPFAQRVCDLSAGRIQPIQIET